MPRSSGNPDLFVQIITDLQSKPKDWKKPTLDLFTERSQGTIGADIIYLSKKELATCGNSCILLFGVRGASPGMSIFSLTVHTGKLQTLSSDQVVGGVIDTFGNYNFYQYYKDCDSCTLQINVQPVSGSVLTLMVNHNKTDDLPDHVRMHDWMRQFSQSGILEIEPHDKVFKN